MKRIDWNYLVDTLLFIFLGGIAFIGFLMGLVIPKGSGASESAKYFLGLHRHEWGNVHFYLSIGFVVVVIIHLILHWSWIKGKARVLFKRGWTTALILTPLASFLVLFIFWALYPKALRTSNDYGGRAGREHRAEVLREEPTSPLLINGQMTLREVERATGISAAKIARVLGLSADVNLDETLGQLRKKFPFTLKEVRDAVARLKKKSESSAEKEAGQENEGINKKKVNEEKIKKSQRSTSSRRMRKNQRKD